MPRASFFTARKELLIGLPMLAIAITAIVQSWTYPTPARLFPASVAVVMVVFALVQIAKDVRGRPRPTARPSALEAGQGEPIEATGQPTRAESFRALAWLAGFFVALWALGFLVAVPLYTFVYLQLESREKLWASLLGAAIAWLFLYVLFVRLLPIPLFEGALLRVLGLS